MNKWQEQDVEFGNYEGDIEIIKGEELLTEEEIDEVIDYVNEMQA